MIDSTQELRKRTKNPIVEEILSVCRLSLDSDPFYNSVDLSARQGSQRFLQVAQTFADVVSAKYTNQNPI